MKFDRPESYLPNDFPTFKEVTQISLSFMYATLSTLAKMDVNERFG